MERRKDERRKKDQPPLPVSSLQETSAATLAVVRLERAYRDPKLAKKVLYVDAFTECRIHTLLRHLLYNYQGCPLRSMMVVTEGIEESMPAEPHIRKLY